MSALTKAYLAEITSGNSPTEKTETKVEVQFNPTSLRVQISNKTAGGQQAGAQARQRPGTGEMQVGFDLVFDTADEGTAAGAGVSVLEKTKSVERFVRPRGAQAGQEAPPRVVFVWGDFQVQGTMESANIDLDLFDAQGVPLRAKVSVSIKGQDPRWTYTAAPAGSPGTGGGSNGSGTGTGLPSGAPGTKGNGLSPARILQALSGESLAQLAARAGFDPGAWRALANGLSNPLKLELGAEVSLPAGAGRSAATGTAAQGTDSARTAASLPLVAPAQAAAPGRSAAGGGATGGGAAGGSAAGASGRPGSATAADPVRQGQAIAQRGGLAGAIAEVKDDAHQQGAGTSLASFGLDAGATSGASDRPWGAGVPLRPRFGSRESAPRRGSDRSPWTLAKASNGGGGTSLASATPLGPARLARRGGGGCGCKDK